jgi:uncharacterized membrane protein
MYSSPDIAQPTAAGGATVAAQFREQLSRLPSWNTIKAKMGPVTNVNDAHEQSLNALDRIALVITSAVGSMYCAMVFAVLALVALPSALEGGPLTIVQWVSQTFLQLVLLSVIMVGQNLQGRHSELRAENDYEVNMKAEMEVETILTHLENQNNLMLEILRRIEELEKREIQIIGKN